MIAGLSRREQQDLRRMAYEPFHWLRSNCPEAKQWEDELYDLLDHIKTVWRESQPNRVPLCFALEWTIMEKPIAALNIFNYSELQKRQVTQNSAVFTIDLKGHVTGDLDIGDEIEPVSAQNLSQIRQIVTFWLGPELEIFCRGYKWNPAHKQEVLKDIKSKRRERLLPMNSYQLVLDTHYQQCIRGEAAVVYWLPGQKNKVLRPDPERIFQKSLCNFINREVDCVQADMEPVFRDGSRCDIRVFLDNFDLCFIEIKWIGYCAKKVRNKAEYSAESPTELDQKYAIGGAYQTKLYIENNNFPLLDQRIKLGIYLLYDAYPDSVTPLNYGQELEQHPLLRIVEYQLVTPTPSKMGREIAKREGLI